MPQKKTTKMIKLIAVIINYAEGETNLTQKTEVKRKLIVDVNLGKQSIGCFLSVYINNPTLNIFFNWSLAIVEYDWFQMLVTEISCTATCMTTNGSRGTRCRPFSIIIAPNRTTRRKCLRFMKASTSKISND